MRQVGLSIGKGIPVVEVFLTEFELQAVGVLLFLFEGGEVHGLMYYAL